jgi:putative ABC transport system permease protein
MSDEPRWRRYLRFRGPDPDADIDDELRSHLEMLEEELRSEGMSAAEARSAALARFGDMDEVRGWLREHDRGRHRRRMRTEALDRWLQDVRYGARKLRQQPGFTAAAVLVLALGIGATSALYSAVDGVLLRPLFPQEEQLVLLDRRIGLPLRLGQEFPKSYPDITDMEAMRRVFSSVAAYAPGGMNLTGSKSPVRVRIGMVTPNLFSTLRIRPSLGRTFAPGEGKQGAPHVAILSDALWQRQFGGDARLLGRAITLNGRNYEVVGVMPRGFAFPSATDVWVPMPVPMTFADMEPFRQFMPSRLVARLAPGVTVRQAGERVYASFVAYAGPNHQTDATVAEAVKPLHDSLVGDRRTALLVLLGATALVLLVACANVANLLLSRAAARRREVALRAALGATPGRIMRQFLVESFLLAAMGGALGVVFALLSLHAITAVIPASLVGTASLRIDGRVLLFTSSVVLLTGLAAGLAPAFGARRTNAGEVVKTGGTGSVRGGESSRLRRVFVVSELGLALMLLIGAGVMLRSFRALVSNDPGLRPEHAATLELTLDKTTYANSEAKRAFMEGVLERLREIPQVQAALVNELPLRGEGGIRFTVQAEGKPAPKSTAEAIFAQDMRVSSGYFRALGIPLLRGRTLSTTSDSLAPGEVVISQELARLLWPGEDPIGKRIVSPGGAQRQEVVGVVGNVRPAKLEDEMIPQIYASILRTPYPNFAVVARGPLPAGELARRMERAIHEVAPDQAVYNVRTMEQVISTTLAPRRTNTLLITLLGALALVLASVGVYGVIAYGVVRRTREIGIRLALGAHPRRIVLDVMREGIVLAAVGTALGLGGAWLLTRALAGLVYGVSARDPLSFVIAPVVLFAIALLASVLPARRAARVDPAAVLGAE